MPPPRQMHGHRCSFEMLLGGKTFKIRVSCMHAVTGKACEFHTRFACDFVDGLLLNLRWECSKSTTCHEKQ